MVFKIILLKDSGLLKLFLIIKIFKSTIEPLISEILAKFGNVYQNIFKEYAHILPLLPYYLYGFGFGLWTWI